MVGPRIATCAPGADAARLQRGRHRPRVVVELGPRDELGCAVVLPAAEPRNVIAPGPSAAASSRGISADTGVMRVRLVIGA